MDLVSEFNLDGAYPYFEMLIRQSKNEIDSWAIRWHASMYLLNKMTLYPHVSLVRNTGQDGSGTHYRSIKRFAKTFEGELAAQPIYFEFWKIEENLVARECMKRYMASKNSFPKSFNNRMMTFLKFITQKVS
jgi:hypothetical protein